jgi:Cytochrome P450
MVIALLVLAFAVSLPYWLPRVVVAIRMWIFARINGDAGITVPGRLVDVSDFRRVYADPAADGRSRGAALSNLFWYWLSPGAHLHQEHLEPGPEYHEVALVTRQILALPKATAEDLAARCVAQVLDGVSRPGLVRLRDLMMPIWADFYYQVVFGETCTPEARKLIVANADDVVTALKCCSLRHMDRRNRLTEYLISRLRSGARVTHELPSHLTLEERALYLQGLFFNTAVVQMSEAMAHLLMVLAEHPEAQAALRAEPDRYADHVINEALRLYPLFGIAHRITSADIHGTSAVIPAGSVLCFDYPAFHRSGFDDPDRFDPDRWEGLSTRDANHIPFGITANRPCPAKGLAPLTMRVAVSEVVRRFRLSTTAAHTRSMPNRGPCLLEPHDALMPRGRRTAALVWLRVRDRWENVWRSLVQLVLGTSMVWHANRLALTDRYFAPAARGRTDRQ